MLADGIVLALEGRMSQFRLLLLMVLEFAQMMRICEGALMGVNFVYGLMMELLLLLLNVLGDQLVLLGCNNLLILEVLHLPSSDKSSLGRRFI